MFFLHKIGVCHKFATGNSSEADARRLPDTGAGFRGPPRGRTEERLHRPGADRTEGVSEVNRKN